MATSIPIVQALDSPEWNADMYGALGSLYRVVAVKANVLRLAYVLHSLNRTLKSLFDKVDAAMRGELKAEPGADVPAPQKLLDSADKLMKLSRDLEYQYELLRRVGLTNNSLTAGSLAKIRAYRGQIEDLADWFELMAQSDAVRMIFERSAGERERGEIFDLEPV